MSRWRRGWTAGLGRRTGRVPWQLYRRVRVSRQNGRNSWRHTLRGHFGQRIVVGDGHCCVGKICDSQWTADGWWGFCKRKYILQGCLVTEKRMVADIKSNKQVKWVCAGSVGLVVEEERKRERSLDLLAVHLRSATFQPPQHFFSLSTLRAAQWPLQGRPFAPYRGLRSCCLIVQHGNALPTEPSRASLVAVSRRSPRLRRSLTMSPRRFSTSMPVSVP